MRDFLTVLGHRYDAGVKALLWTVGLDELPCFCVLSDQPGRRVASTHIGAQGKPIRELAPITTECKDTSAGIRDGIRPPRRGRATAPMAPRPAARGAPDDRWGSPSRACLNVGSSAARLHQSIVHAGRAIDTCDVEIGPRYRLSQLFGTRVLTSQSSSAPTSRPHAACGNARPGCRRRRPSCWEDGDRDGHRLGSDLHYIAGEGNDRLEHRLYAAAAWESTQATIHLPPRRPSNNRPVQPARRARREIHVQPERTYHGDQYAGHRRGDYCPDAIWLHAERHRTCRARAGEPRSTPERACFTTSSDVTRTSVACEVKLYLALPSYSSSRLALPGSHR